MMSILECAVLADHFRSHKGVIYFGVRTLEDTFYLEELSRYVAASHRNLDVTIALSHQVPESSLHATFPALKLASGMVHQVAAEGMAGCDRNVRNVTVYVAGPSIMVDSTIRSLLSSGIAIKDIRYDKFS
jgi:toluene monooxygenase electron transfer component